MDSTMDSTMDNTMDSTMDNTMDNTMDDMNTEYQDYGQQWDVDRVSLEFKTGETH